MSGEEEPQPTEPPRLWVESFCESEREVRSVLDETLEAHVLGEYETVRERLRAFSEAEYGIFRIVTFSLLEIETFFEDVEAQYDEEETAPTDDLRALGEEYGRLREEFELLYAEQSRELRNPMPALRRGFRYSESIDLPRLDYDLYSGDVRLCGFVHPPSQALMLARAVVASSRELLETVEENDDTVAASEREQLAFVYEKLAAEVDQLAAHVENDGEGDGGDGGDEDEESDGLDEAGTYHDWSFY